MTIDFVMLIIWAVVAVAFVVLEFISSKYFLPIAMGAAVAAVATLFSLGQIVQVVLFVVVTALAYLLLRPHKKRDRYDCDERGRRRSRQHDDDAYFD